MKQKFPYNYKVIFKTRKLSLGVEVYYKIDPKELNFFQRIFFNPWNQLTHHKGTSSRRTTLFSQEEYEKDIMPLKTFGDVYIYIKEEALQYSSTSLENEKKIINNNK